VNGNAQIAFNWQPVIAKAASSLTVQGMNGYTGQGTSFYVQLHFSSPSPAPTGVVSILVNGSGSSYVNTPLNTATCTPVTGGQNCTMWIWAAQPWQAAGTFPIQAVYSGDANYLPSTSPISYEHTKSQTALAVSLPPVPNAGQTQYITVTVVQQSPQYYGPSPTGNIEFDTGNGAGYIPYQTGNDTAYVPITWQHGCQTLGAIYNGDAYNGFSSWSTTVCLP
jgi:hypothetical protein